MGRRKSCSIIFDDTRISGQHARIFREIKESHEKSGKKQHDVFIEDLSSNGTFVNLNKLGKGNRQLLKSGDEISLVALKGKKECVMSYIFRDLTLKPKRAEKIEGEISKFYDIQDVILGTGNFSVVKLGLERRTGIKRAIKIIDKAKYWNSTKNKESLNREINILKTIKHKHIVSIIDIFSTQKCFYLVLELVNGGELFDSIVDKGFYSEEEARKVFFQILDAVHYLHKEGIAHRDLKPENILIDKTQDIVKITDFGLARIVGSREMMTTWCGTPQYAAPEIIKQSWGEMDGIGYGKEVDIWSLGTLLYVMLSGYAPFNSPGEQLYEQIEEGKYEFPEEFWSDVSSSAKDLIQKMLTVNPKERITIEQALVHPWIKGTSDLMLSPFKQLNSVKENLQKYKTNIKTNLYSPVKFPTKHSGSETEEEESRKRRSFEDKENENSEKKQKVSKKLF